MARLALAVLLWAASLPALAAITCNFSSSVYTLDFVSYKAGATSVTSTNALRQMQVTATCTRGLATDSTTIYLGITNGLYASGQGNNMRFTAGAQNYDLAYDVYKDSTCGTMIRDQNASVRVATTLASVTTQQQVTFNFYGCIPNAQSMTGYPTGTYTDSAVMTIRDGNTAIGPAATIAARVFAPGSCSITNGPANIAFTYTGFAAAAQYQSSSFNANCTNLMPYTLTVSPTTGVIGGLRYSVGLTASTAGTTPATGAATYSGTGNSTGTQLFYVNAYMPGSQPGSAAAISSQAHTVTVSY